MAEPNARLAEILTYLDNSRAALFATARSISSDLASIRPRSGEWSVEEILAHLALVENAIGRLVTSSIRKAREEGIGPDPSHSSLLSSLDQFRVPDSPKKLTAPTTIAPDAAVHVGQSLAALEQSREKLRQTLVDAADVNLSAIVRTHPALGELNLYQWALFVGQHEERHRRQMERTIDEVTERAAESAPIV